MLTIGLSAVLARKHKDELRWIAGGAALCLGCFGAVGAWFLGLGRGTVGEPSYSLPHYLESRARVAETTWWAEGSVGGLLHDLIREGLWNHIGPAFTVLLLPGLLLLPWALARKPSSPDSPGDVRSRRALVAVLFLAALPLVLLATSNQAFLADWIYLAPTGVLLCLVGLRSWTSRMGSWRRPVRLGFALSCVVVGFSTAVFPLTRSLELGNPEAPTGPGSHPVTDLFLRSSSGGADLHPPHPHPHAGCHRAAGVFPGIPEREHRTCPAGCLGPGVETPGRTFRRVSPEQPRRRDHMGLGSRRDDFGQTPLGLALCLRRILQPS